MVKLLDLEMSSATFVIRVICAAVIASLTFLLLFLVPMNLTFLTAAILGEKMPTQLCALVSSLVDPNLPLLGLALVPIEFLNVLLRGTRAQGPITIALSFLFIAYISLAFHGGFVGLEIPTSLMAGSTAPGKALAMHLDLFMLMILFIAPQLLGLVKGLLLTARRQD